MSLSLSLSQFLLPFSSKHSNNNNNNKNNNNKPIGRSNPKDPAEILQAHGADALRLYLINSPVVRAEPLRFQQEGVREVVKVVFLPWYNAYRFLVQSARRWEEDNGGGEGGGGGGGGGGKAAVRWRPDPSAAEASANVLDRWLLASCRELARFVRAEMGAYRLYTVVPRLTRFIADLTNVYVRFNRSRLKGKDSSGAAGGDDDGENVADADADAADAPAPASASASAPPVDAEADRMAALSTLHSVLTELCVIMAPFTPFLCEHMWRNLRRALVEGSEEEGAAAAPAPAASEAANASDGANGDDASSSSKVSPCPSSGDRYPASVHWAPFPPASEDRDGDDAVRRGVEAMQRAIELARTVRERGVRPLKQPLRAMVVVHPDPAVLALLTREFFFFFFCRLRFFLPSFFSCSSEGGMADSQGSKKGGTNLFAFCDPEKKNSHKKTSKPQQQQRKSQPTSSATSSPRPTSAPSSSPRTPPSGAPPRPCPTGPPWAKNWAKASPLSELLWPMPTPTSCRRSKAEGTTA